MKIHYLEIVTQEVNAVCATYAVANDAQFGDHRDLLRDDRSEADRRSG
jgi:hypothetical protein